MSEFSEAISSVLTIIFLVFMASVIITQYKKGGLQTEIKVSVCMTALVKMTALFQQ